MSNFWTRIISGIGMIGLTLGLFWVGPWGMLLFAVLIISGGIPEFYNLKGINQKGEQILSITLGVTALVCWTFGVPFIWVLLGLLIISSAGVLVGSISSISLFSHFYITIPLGLLQFVSFQWQNQYHFEFPLFLMVLVWSSDSWAYVSGKLFGRNKLAPSISPGKTWEGLIGGTVLTAITAYFYSHYFLTDFYFPDGRTPIWSETSALILGILVSIFGTLGDLFESKMKRKAGVKDSGNVIPGHGGILDRFDAFFFAISVMAIFHLITYVLVNR